jgi:hypothetical protein
LQIERKEVPLIFYCDMKLEWAAAEYTICCTRNKRSRLTWLRLAFGNSEGRGKDLRKEDTLCMGREKCYTYNILLKCS